jgi:hypothetical protein
MFLKKYCANIRANIFIVNENKGGTLHEYLEQ